MRPSSFARLLAVLLLSSGLAAVEASEGAKSAAAIKASQPNSTNYGDRYSRVSLWLTHESLALVKLSEKSRIDLFEDDQGNDLREAPDRRRRRGPIRADRWLDEASRFTVDLSGKAPAKDAKTVRAKGTLVFHAASKTNRVKSELAALTAGSTIEVGGRTFKIMMLMEQPDTPKDSTARTLVLTTHEELDDVAGIRFLDAEGKEIEGDDYGSGSSRMFGVRTITLNYHLERIPEKASIELEVYADLREIEVPFDITQKVVR